jgi:hypothetical protein
MSLPEEVSLSSSHIGFPHVGPSISNPPAGRATEWVVTHSLSPSPASTTLDGRRQKFTWALSRKMLYIFLVIWSRA